MAKTRIPEGIGREHVLQAMQDFRDGIPHGFGPSLKFDVVEDGHRYPPKAIVGLAARRAAGVQLGPSDFSGGETSACNDLLRNLGFAVEPKADEEAGDFDRSDPNSAQGVLDALFTKWADSKQPWLDLLDTCLERCKTNPSSWSLTLSPHRMILNTGRALLLGLADDGVWFTYDFKTTADADADWLRVQTEKHPEPFDNYPTLALARVRGDIAPQALARFRTSILAAADIALAKSLKRPPMWRTHSDGGLQQLEILLGHKLPRPDLLTGGKGRSYWKIAPEARGQLWEQWRKGGYASIGWSELGDMTSIADREAFDAKVEAIANSNAGYTKSGAGQVWKFANIAPGDVILANRGTTEVLGVGDVVSSYYYDPRDTKHPHRIDVKWRDMAPIQVSQTGWRRTLVQLGRSDFERIVGHNALATQLATGTKGPAAIEGSRFERVLEQLEDLGLQFPEELVADFLLALQTKRFVILSGVSGTGKSRIAIEVARAFRPTVERRVAAQPPDGGVALEVLPYMLKHHRFILPASFVAEQDLPPRAEGSMDVVIETPADRETQRLYRAKDRDVTALLMKQGVRRWFEDNLEAGDVFFLQGLPGERGPSFRLSVPTSATETGKLENLAVVAVRPDWTDHRGLLGYFNPITEEYSTTPFLDLLLRASADCQQAAEEGRTPHPFFALLDEMNLARVEHFFADFLSALESGEPLHLHDSLSAEEGETTSGTNVPRQLSIPPNVFFIGTVNVDESTYMFSPKVLDRAFTLEFNDVHLGARNVDAEECEVRLNDLPDSIVPSRGPTPEDWSTLQAEHEGLAKVVQDLHSILAEEHRHFGYRVANEIARFVLLAIEQAGVEAGDAALDLALLHKVLPKLHGSQHELEPLIDRLLAFAILGDKPSLKDIEHLRDAPSLSLHRGKLVRSTTDPDDEDQPRLPRVAGKLFRMRIRLKRQGFTSFIE